MKIVYQTLIPQSVRRYNDDGSVTDIPFAPGNTSYDNFKAQINADEAILEDKDGVDMTPEQAKAYVATLP